MSDDFTQGSAQLNLLVNAVWWCMLSKNQRLHHAIYVCGCGLLGAFYFSLRIDPFPLNYWQMDFGRSLSFFISDFRLKYDIRAHL